MEVQLIFNSTYIGNVYTFSIIVNRVIKKMYHYLHIVNYHKFQLMYYIHSYVIY